MNVLDLIIAQLTLEKNLLESELERVVNDKDISIPKKVEMSKEILEKISHLMTTISVTNGYLSPLKKKEENNN